MFTTFGAEPAMRSRGTGGAGVPQPIQVAARDSVPRVRTVTLREWVNPSPGGATRRILSVTHDTPRTPT